MGRQPTILLTVKGETLSVVEWSERTGISPDAIWDRLLRGFSPEAAIIPVRDKYAEDSSEYYTINELYELYTGFAGRRDEVKILAELAGTTTDEARELLDRFRIKRKRAGR